MIGILGATPEEVASLIENLENKKTITYGKRDYHQGTLFGKNVVIAFSRWGKVASSATTATMIHRFHIKKLIFIGVAGSLDPFVKQGDIVISNELYQHDMDGSPLFKLFEIPLLGTSEFKPCPSLKEKAYIASQNFLEGTRNKLHQGTVLSGDQFIASPQKVSDLKKAFPNALAVEMEGAAVGQICFEHSLPFIIIRSISDNADDDAFQDFETFLKNTASPYAKGILEGMLGML